MDYRNGKCSQCGAEYQVPASFAHSVARCKRCRGVVHLSAPQRAQGAQGNGGAPAPVPPRRTAPRPAAERTGAPEARPSAAPAAFSRPSAPSPAEAGETSAPRERPLADPVRPTAARPAAARTPEVARAEPQDAPRAPTAQKKPSLGLLLGAILIGLAALFFFLFRSRLFGTPPSAGSGADEATPAAADASPTGTGSASEPR